MAGSGTGRAVGKKIGQVLRLRPEKYAEYKRLHQNVPEPVLRTIRASNISDFTIFYNEDVGCLFSTFVYHGDDFDGDMAKIGECKDTQEWWKLCMPCQDPVDGEEAAKAAGHWWKTMENLFHMD